jgi:hypothetical protein
VRRRREKKGDGSGGQAEQALGRSRGGFSTKIHGSIDGLGHPIELKVTAAQEADIAQAEDQPADHTPEVVIADKGYDKKALIQEIEARGAQTVIPTQKDFKEQRGRSAPVPGAERVRALLAQGEAVPARGDPL